MHTAGRKAEKHLHAQKKKPHRRFEELVESVSDALWWAALAESG